MTCLIGDCGLPRVPGLGKSLGFGAVVASAGPIGHLDHGQRQRSRAQAAQGLRNNRMNSHGLSLVFWNGRPTAPRARMVRRHMLQTNDALFKSRFRSSAVALGRAAFLQSLASADCVGRAWPVILSAAASSRSATGQAGVALSQYAVVLSWYEVELGLAIRIRPQLPTAAAGPTHPSFPSVRPFCRP